MNRFFVAFLIVASLPAQGIGGSLEVEDAATEIEQRLGAVVPGGITFRREDDTPVTLSEILAAGRPVILNVGYFGCPRLCGEVTKGMALALRDIAADQRLTDVEPGRDVELITLSFDPAEYEARDLALAKKKAFLDFYGRPEAARHWHFLRADKANANAITKAVGFNYRWNETSKAYDHRAVLILLSPTGKITRYLAGALFDPATLRLAVVEASEGKIGTTREKILLSCYGYDPATGTYSRLGHNVMAIGGAITLLALGSLLLMLWRQTTRRHPIPAIQ